MTKISQKTVSRALRYIRALENLIKQKHRLVSSKELAAVTGVTDVQIRKDISSFGKVGRPRIGYRTAELKNVLEDFVLQDDMLRIALFGVGNLGTAILKYPGFLKDRIRVVAAFDVEPQKIGKKVGLVTVYPFERAPQIIRKTRANIGIIAVPQGFSQDVADLMVLAGLRGIVNFSPASVSVPAEVRVKDIDLTIEFLSLFCEIHK
ncbi:MAG: redox-sensing transcriptional repressor Rex [Candidatus Omnitrophota bacterium]|jgi:redox-sensing transcriptional repressor